MEHIHPYANYTVNEILTHAATAERRRTHPIASAILAEAKRYNLDRQLAYANRAIPPTWPQGHTSCSAHQ